MSDDDDKVTPIRTSKPVELSHIKEAADLFAELADKRELTTLAIVAIDAEGNAMASFAHDGDPDCIPLLGGLQDLNHTILDWMKDKDDSGS